MQAFGVGNLVISDGKYGVIAELKHITTILHAVVQFGDGNETTLPCVSLEKCTDNPIQKIKHGLVCDYPEDFYFHLTAKRLELKNKFEPYTFLANSRLMLQPHQVFVAHKVTQKMHPRFILADEVGLGKTIEAGMIMKELMARGHVKRVLIAAPASLVTQWQREMENKFNEHFTLYNRDTLNYYKNEYPGQNPWMVKDSILVSVQFARREDVAPAIASIEWDLVIFDEAHHLRSQLNNDGSVNSNLAYQFGREITAKTKAMLLLTATPMQLHDFEFYSMTKLVDPTLFKSYGVFKSYRESTIPEMNNLYDSILQYDKLSPKQMSKLVHGIRRTLNLEGSIEDIARKMCLPVERKKLSFQLMNCHPLAEIMIRNRKKSIGGFAQRKAHTIDVNLSIDEQDLYNEVSEYVTAGYRTAIAHKRFIVGFLLVIFQKLLTSSTYSLARSLERRIERITSGEKQAAAGIDINEYYEDYDDMNEVWEDILRSANHTKYEVAKLKKLIEKAKAIKTDTKLRQLTKILNQIFINSDEKVLIFTQFRDTLEYLRSNLSRHWSVTLFHGGMKIADKDQATEAFRNHVQIMISTDSGGEGRNFQFCHNLINYDLPWNPMKIEQRIGRVDRFGQKYNVNVYNFSIAGTVEERIYRVLNDRIKIFEETIGGLEPILGDVEKRIEKIIIDNRNNPRELVKFEQDLQTKIFLAKEMEEKLRDFIMDTSSFDRVESEKVMLANTRDFHNEIQSFILDFFSRYSGFKPEQYRPGIFELEIPKVFIEGYRDLPGCDKFPLIHDVYYAAFSPEVASENENTSSFIAFGHELLESVVAYCNYKLPETAAAYTIERPSKNIPPQKGILFNFLVKFQGVQEKQTIIPVFVDSNCKGSVHTGLELYTLRTFDDIKPDYSDLNVDKLYSIAQEVLVPLVVKDLEGYKEDSIRKLQEERMRVRKFANYQISVERDKVEVLRQRIEGLKTRQKQIIPIWRKQIEDHHGVIVKWEKYRTEQLLRLDKISHDSYSFSLFSAAVIKII